jgi:hypothetical protein
MHAKNIGRLVATGIAVAAIGCDIDQTREAELPEVEVRGGQMPQYDVDTADIDVNERPAEVNVPDIDVDVDTERRRVTVPDVDVTMPDDEPETER